MKNISTGTGLCVLGLCLAAYPIIDRIMPRAEAGGTHVAAVVAAAATAQVPPEPTIVWYGIGARAGAAKGTYLINSPFDIVYRAWSDGRIEAKGICTNDCSYIQPLPSWTVINDPNSGYNAAADINYDSKVDGSDLAQVLNDWGNAPRQDIVPSTCPLNLINP